MQDLFALEPEAPKPVASDPLSFDALQEKARREGVKGLSAREKAAYLQSLQQKVKPPATEHSLPSPAPTEARSAVERLPTYRPGQQSLTYAGIGSRETPEDVRAIMQQVAGYLERKGYTLQTGDALGADSAFASGCQRKRIFTAADATELTLEIAQEVHPAPWLLPSFARRLMARHATSFRGRPRYAGRFSTLLDERRVYLARQPQKGNRRHRSSHCTGLDQRDSGYQYPERKLAGRIKGGSGQGRSEVTRWKLSL